MKIILQTYISIFMLAIVVFISSGLILVNMQGQMARNFYATCIENIENSGCDAMVILDCQRMAEKYGYTFLVDDCSIKYEQEEIPTIFIQLDYKVKVPFLRITEESSIKGYSK